MSVVAVVQARTGSSRLPGKVLEEVGGRPMVLTVLGRLGRSEAVDAIVLATSDDASDDRLADVVAQAGYTVHRGSTHDVLDRFHGAVKDWHDADEVVRVTADCPFVDPDMVTGLVDFRRRTGADFAANRLPPPARRTVPVGLDVEVATVRALRTAWAQARAPHHREHVMPYLYESGLFTTAVLDLPEDLSSYRWTVDTAEDLEVVRRLWPLCGPEPFGWRSVLDAARLHPEITVINAAVVQKDVDAVDERSDVDRT